MVLQAQVKEIGLLNLVASQPETPDHGRSERGAGLGARRNEDIALDLLKFVAGTAGRWQTCRWFDWIQRSLGTEAWEST